MIAVDIEQAALMLSAKKCCNDAVDIELAYGVSVGFHIIATVY